MLDLVNTSLGDGTFEDLDALTTYIIEVTATNNAGNETTKEFSITTGELRK